MKSKRYLLVGSLLLTPMIGCSSTQPDEGSLSISYEEPDLNVRIPHPSYPPLVLGTTTTQAPANVPSPTTRSKGNVSPTTTAPPDDYVEEEVVIQQDDPWTVLADCESGDGDVGPPYSMSNDMGGPFYGYFQFSESTWHSVGGEGLPSDHEYSEQLSRAITLQARSGWGQWPSCSKRMRAEGYI